VSVVEHVNLKDEPDMHWFGCGIDQGYTLHTHSMPSSIIEA
jgi:hypothetical protein